MIQYQYENSFVLLSYVAKAGHLGK